MIERLTGRKEWMFFAALPRAGGALAIAWWTAVVLRGVLPAVFAVAMGALVVAVQRGDSLTPSLAVVGAAFVLLQVLTPIQTAISLNLGDRTAAFLYDRLTAACVRPAGMGHLENPSLTADMTAARDFDLGMTGPPLSYSMDFIAGGLVGMLTGLTAAVVLAGFAWWAPIVLGGAWLSTHWLLRESAVWHDRQTDEVRGAQRDADYAYRLAVDPPASKELRLFGLVQMDHRPLRRAAHPPARPAVQGDAAARAPAGVVRADRHGREPAGAVGAGGRGGRGTHRSRPARHLRAAGGEHVRDRVWRLQLGARRGLGTGGRRGPAGAGDARGGTRWTRVRATPPAMPAREVRFRGVSFAYPGGAEVLKDFDLTIPAGSSLAIVGQNGAGKTTLAKLLCRLYDPQAGAIEIDGVDLRQLELSSWRTRLAAVFQDFIRFERPLRDNVAPNGAPDDVVWAALRDAGGESLARLDTVLARGYDGGTDLSGGQWQRVALARALCAVKMGAGLVLLDEPTAQLDVRGEAEIFDRILATTRHCTTILISHRFSTVRHADRICVLEKGRVVELGTHDELIALGGRYRTMFDLQAQRFGEDGRRPDL